MLKGKRLHGIMLAGIPVLLASLGACTDYTPEKVADAKSITIEDAYASIGRGFLALQKEMAGAKMGVITCKVDIKFAIAAQASQNNDLQAGVSGGPQYVQAKLSNDYSTSAAGNRSNTVEIVWGSLYPTICQPVDATGGAANATQNNGNNSGGGSTQGSKGGSKSSSNSNATGNGGAASARSAQVHSPRAMIVMARDVVGVPILKGPAIGLIQAADTTTAPTSTPCKSDEIEAHDTQGRIICIPEDQVMDVMKNLFGTPAIRNEMKSLLQSPDAQNPNMTK
ncbi:MAG TPA: hypothetical protein VMF32_16860 [Xanthobacteraceae bacterium]|nr:hypothetical protein [Xanthobacteraceae bacterium]HUN38907.1 hypothetical protein [Acetobacteraceae bacterium]